MKRITCLEELADIMHSGGVIAYPTEAVWGLGCDPFNEGAVIRILQLKSRPIEKGLILVAGDESHLAPWTKTLDKEAKQRLIRPTGIATSWVVPDQGIAPLWVRGQHLSVAIRLSQHLPVQALCLAFGGTIVSTSANPAELDPAMSATAVDNYFGKGIDAIYDAPLGDSLRPSQVKDLVYDTLFRT